MEVDYEKKFTALTITREDRLITVMLNRPEAMNAVTRDMHEQLEYFWYDVAGDDTIGAIILTGAGNRGFCTGADMKNMSAGIQSGEPRAVARSYVSPKRLISSMLEVEQPIIGAINGDAVGMGCSLAFACDIIVASDRARFADTHVKNLGVTAGDGGTVTWPLMMGIHKAKEYLLTGDFLYAKDAAAAGYINYAVPFEEVMPRAREFGLKFANGPSWAQRWTKSAINKTQRQLLELNMDTALATEWLCFATEDHKEAVAAFMEKRPGKFKGR